MVGLKPGEILKRGDIGMGMEMGVDDLNPLDPLPLPLPSPPAPPSSKVLFWVPKVVSEGEYIIIIIIAEAVG